MEANKEHIAQQDFMMEEPDDSAGALALSTTIYLKNLPKDFTELGVTNLCLRYVKVVKGVRMYDEEKYKTNCALVFLSTHNDAEHCIGAINNSTLGIFAFFQQDKKKDDQLQGSTSLDSDEEKPIVEANTNFNHRKVDSRSTKPMKWTSFEIKPLLSSVDYAQSNLLKNFDPHMDFLNVSNNIILAEDLKNEKITDGRSHYRHLGETKNEMKNQHKKSQGTLDMKKQEFVHNGGKYVSESDACKCCGIITITFCGGCLDFFCSHHCWVNCCKCKKKVSDEFLYRSRRIISGKEEKLNIPLSNVTIKVNESNLKGTSTVKMSSRTKILQRCLEAERKSLQERTISRCQIPSNNTLVVITTVIDHTRVLLRSIKPDDNNEYVKYLNDLAECSKTAKTLEEIPKKDDIVLAEFQNSYYRAIVVRIEGDMVVVVYLEFGNLGKKSLSQLKSLSEHDDLRFKKRFTFKACLTGVDGELLNDKAPAYLYNLLEGYIPLKFVRQDNTFSPKGVLCELLQNDSNENINRKIATLNTVNSTDRFELNVFTSTLSGEHVPVIVLDNKTLIYGHLTVIQKDNVQKLIKMQKRISEYCKEGYEGQYTAINNEICLAKHDDDWYRVMLSKASGDGNPLMNLIDFGIFANIDVINMRPMPPEFYYPCYAVFAEIGGIPKELTKEQQDKLMEHFPIESTVIVDKCDLRKAMDLHDDVDTPIIYFKDLKI